MLCCDNKIKRKRKEEKKTPSTRALHTLFMFFLGGGKHWQSVWHVLAILYYLDDVLKELRDQKGGNPQRGKIWYCYHMNGRDSSPWPWPWDIIDVMLMLTGAWLDWDWDPRWHEVRTNWFHGNMCFSRVRELLILHQIGGELGIDGRRGVDDHRNYWLRLGLFLDTWFSICLCMVSLYMKTRGTVLIRFGMFLKQK